jgi:hypothetical protein
MSGEQRKERREEHSLRKGITKYFLVVSQVSFKPSGNENKERRFRFVQRSFST